MSRSPTPATAAHRRPPTAAFLGLLALSIPAWFVNLATPALWTDEAFSLRYGATLPRTLLDAGNPAGSYALLHGWTRLLGGATVEHARSLSALLALAAAVVWIPLFRRPGPGPRWPMVAAWGLLVLGPHALLYGHLARYFALAEFLVAVALLCLVRYAETGRGWLLAAAGAAELALVLSHYFLPAALMVVEVALLWRAARFSWRVHVLRWAAVAATGVGILISLGQHAPYRSTDLGQLFDLGRATKVGVGTAYGIASLLVGENLGVRDLWVAAAALVCWALAFGALIRVVRGPGSHDSERALMAAGAAAGALAALVTAVAVAQVSTLPNIPFQIPKLLFPFAPLAYLAAGAGVTATSRRRRAVAAVVIGTMAVCGSVNVLGRTNFLYSPYDMPWDDVAASLTAEADTSDAVFTADGPLLVYLVFDRARPTVYRTADLAGDDVVADQAIRDRRHDRVFVVRRDTVQDGLSTRLDAVEANLRRAGYVRGAARHFGHQSSEMRRLRSLASRRQLREDLVTVRIYTLP
jgi:hypothetical protein